jgi:FixJ family two-component response regulator
MLASTGETTRGWQYTFAGGRAGHYLALRPALAKYEVAAQLSDQAIYPYCAVDADVKPLDGANKLYEHLRATSPARPITLMSALDDADSRRRADAVVFLAKPFSSRSLLDALRRASLGPQAHASPPLSL